MLLCVEEVMHQLQQGGEMGVEYVKRTVIGSLLSIDNRVTNATAELNTWSFTQECGILHVSAHLGST